MESPRVQDRRGPARRLGPADRLEGPRAPYTHAIAIPDMLDRLYRETKRSVGRMAALPPIE